MRNEERDPLSLYRTLIDASATRRLAVSNAAEGDRPARADDNKVATAVAPRTKWQGERKVMHVARAGCTLLAGRPRIQFYGQTSFRPPAVCS